MKPAGVRPSWLLALVFFIGVASVVAVILGGHEDNVWQVIEVIAPVLAALFVVDHVNTRSDAQDVKLEEHATTLRKVETSVNGALTKRLEESAEPARQAIADVHEELRRTGRHRQGDDDTPEPA